MNQILIYTQTHTERQAYVFDFIFKEVLGIPYKKLTNVSDFGNAPGFKINYTQEAIEADLQIVPATLLFENDIKSQTPAVSKWGDLPIFFESGTGDIPFDLFSSIFYLISRYEEYLPYTPDEFERFPHANSMAYKNNFLHLPIADLWIQELKKIMLQMNKALMFNEAGFRFLPTYDIDIAYSYLGKNAVTQVAGFARDLIQAKFSSVRDRLLTLAGKQTDPYDSYAFLDNMHQTYLLAPVYFFLVGERGPLDKNLAFENAHFQKLYKEIADKYAVGLHPSYQSHQDISILKSEKEKLKTEKSRQHYIRFTLPQTYHNLLQIGIREDYSMGYGSINGFRAGTSHPFYWFDLAKNEKTSLKLFPFCYMECNSFFEQHYSKEQAFEEMLHYYEVVKNTGGQLITIWHNFSLGTDRVWTGWKAVYKKFLQEVYDDLNAPDKR